jgi:methylated-DNA-protein-cysteine methyltransferase-like protein
LLTGKHHFETPDTMAKKLNLEGVIVKNDQIQNFKTHFWDPFLALHLDA